MKTKIHHIIMMALMCIAALCTKGQIIERGCDDDMWNFLMCIKAEVDNGMGYSSLHELESINDKLFNRQKDNMDKTYQALILSSSTLAELYTIQGDYYKADSLLSKYSNCIESIYGFDFRRIPFYEEESPNILIARKKSKKDVESMFGQFFYSYGFLYYYMGNIERAKNLLEEAKNVYIINNETLSVDYLKCLLLLSSCYSYEDDIVLEQLYYETALDVFKQLKQKGDVQKLDYLEVKLYSCSAGLNKDLNKKEAAARDREEFISIYKENVFDNLDEYVGAIIEKIVYDESETKTLYLAKELLPRVSQPFLKSILLYTILYFIDENDDDFMTLFEQYDSITKTCLSKWIYNFSSLELEPIWTRDAILDLIAYNEKAYHATMRKVDGDTLVVDKAYDNVMFTKSFLLKRKQLLDNIEKENESTWLTVVGSTIGQIKNDVLSRSIYRENYSQLEKNLIESNQKRWNAGIENLRRELNHESVKLELGPNDVAVEFSFISDSVYSENKKVYFCAYVLRKAEGFPKIISLCEAQQFNGLIEELNVADNYVDIEKKEKTRKYLINDLYNNVLLYEQLWKPLEDSCYVHENDNVYYSLTGNLNKINLEALKTSDGRRLMDKYHFRQVLTTADIKSLKSEKPYNFNGAQAVVYGGINYSTKNDEMISMAMAQPGVNRCAEVYDFWRTSRERGFDFLSNTVEEAYSVADMLGKMGCDTVVYMNSMATEESFKYLSRRMSGKDAPDFIHIATHGFFKESKVDREMSVLSGKKGSTQKNDDMFYCGLAFSGANNAWRGNPVEGIDDGILTAEEILWMDLSGCKLVVLSACETGLGTVDFVDGVFGLQRGFKLAGADKILMSLWNVNDAATALLMTNFYENLTNGDTAHDALEKAKQSLIDGGTYSDPYYWAGFVLLE